MNWVGHAKMKFGNEIFSVAKVWQVTKSTKSWMIIYLCMKTKRIFQVNNRSESNFYDAFSFNDK